MGKFKKIGTISGMASATLVTGIASKDGILNVNAMAQQMEPIVANIDPLTDTFSGATSELCECMNDAADGNYPALTTVLGLMSLFSGSSSADPFDIFIIRTDNKYPYNLVEKKAQNIYDKYDKNHIKGSLSGTSLIASSEVAEVVNDIIENTDSKEELLTNIASLEEMLKEETCDSIEEPKVKSIKYGKNK